MLHKAVDYSFGEQCLNFFFCTWIFGVSTSSSHSIAIISPSNSEPLLYFFYPSLQFWSLLCLFQSSWRELQSLWNFSDSFVFPLPQRAKCSVEWQGLFMTKVPSMSICPQREAQLQGHALLWMPDPTPISSNEHYVCHCCLFWAIAAGREAFCHPSHHYKLSLTSFFSK